MGAGLHHIINGDMDHSVDPNSWSRKIDERSDLAATSVTSVLDNGARGDISSDEE